MMAMAADTNDLLSMESFDTPWIDDHDFLDEAIGANADVTATICDKEMRL